MKNEDLIFYGSIGVTTFIIIYLVLKKRAEKQSGAGAVTTPPAPTSGGGSWSTGGGSQPQTPPLNLDKVLYRGVSGANAEVTQLQLLINEYILQNPNATTLQTLTVDGVFGEQTETAVVTLSNNTTNSITLREAYAAAGQTPPTQTTTSGGGSASSNQITSYEAYQQAQQGINTATGFWFLNWF